MTSDPVKVTVAVAKALNCSMKSDKHLKECLRSKTLQELVNVDFPVSISLEEIHFFALFVVQSAKPPQPGGAIVTCSAVPSVYRHTSS